MVTRSAAVEFDRALADALHDYAHAVAAAVGVSPDGVTCEVTDTATAYVPLAVRTADYPQHDLMLVWGERRGWAILLETRPAEAPVVLGAANGDTVLPPAAVVSFIAATLEKPLPDHPVTSRSGRPDRGRLAARLRCHTPKEKQCRTEP